MNINSCSVKVMRSYDYCHFEVVLGATAEVAMMTQDIDELRKVAARLADHAVRQYQKRKAALGILKDYDTKMLRRKVEEIEKRGDTERTPEEQAAIKELGDRMHMARYDYEGCWYDEDEQDCSDED